MPIVNGRLTCCQCGADLGDASDPYRDPDCARCLERELREDAEFDDESLDELDDDRGDDPVEWSDDEPGQRARERWARRYDALNGAPESDYDR